jgi:alkanesulfonate monooxygenase SsuD/methylene tetrahydromethanopterin reductase-like flavin-dependent oxidoreductase (luciferase family)
MRLSVLDQSVAVAGRPHDQSIRNTVALARHCEGLGYERFWVSEHHNHPTIVGTAPEIVMAAIAATTERIRIGSAGIMLPHYSAFKVAEVFRVLDALAPGRIDMGLGRAPGSDGLTAYALNPMAAERPEHFPADIRDLMAWVHDEPLVEGHPFAKVKAYPAGPTAPGDLDPRQLRLRRPGRRAVRPALLLRLVLQRRRRRRAARSTSTSAPTGRARGIRRRAAASASGRSPPRPLRRRSTISPRACSPASTATAACWARCSRPTTPPRCCARPTRSGSRGSAAIRSPAPARR